MSSTFRGLSQAQINKRIKEGRGQGSGSAYKPFINTWDVSSLGRSHRLFGSKSRRMHHLLSDLELAIFLTLEWSTAVLDIREQFPLIVGDTVRIAADLGINHAKFSGAPQVLSSDFLVDFDDKTHPTKAFQAKYSSDLKKPETIERLMLEKRYWDEKGIPWQLITEREVSRDAFTNIQWLYPAQSEGGVSLEDLRHYHDLFSHEFKRSPDRPLTGIAQRLDVAYNLDTGHSLYWLRQLLARHLFLFDINTPYRKLTPLDLVGNDHSEVLEVASASG